MGDVGGSFGQFENFVSPRNGLLRGRDLSKGSKPNDTCES